jgi:hypothetical protein
LIDISTNGARSGPIHSPSDILLLQFQAGVNISGVEVDEDQVHISLAAPAGLIWQIESKELFSESSWTPVGESFPGANRVQVITDDRPLGSQRFYRAVGSPAVP